MARKTLLGRTRRGLGGAAALAALIALAVGGTASSPADPSAGAAAATKISMGDNFFKPAKQRVKPGTKVTWTNDGSSQHTATADNGKFDTGTLSSGETGSRTFKRLGKYPYFCEIHPTMQGKINVCKKVDGKLTCRK